ncbi:hypothetical protein SULYE_0980 [Sulfurihydrogenibium yellowstonense SS-5]|uniref:Uncharacterized protein n=1 Tax=Sulfurihydrogenibium yellowstonense SS-5 TaxID=432331 RepID=C4FK80_9AQUI|nr:hypothetical protein SULYE_0980 [Sulfurihydrogenibium yellowstonense SS-5]
MWVIKYSRFGFTAKLILVPSEPCGLESEKALENFKKAEEFHLNRVG